jgi:mannose-6-phosphate isomerase
MLKFKDPLEVKRFFGVLLDTMLLEPYRENRPRESFEQSTLIETSTVNLLNIKAGEQLSVQKHKNREEFWHVVDEENGVLVDEDWLSAKIEDEFFVNKGVGYLVKKGGRIYKFLKLPQVNLMKII